MQEIALAKTTPQSLNNNSRQLLYTFLIFTSGVFQVSTMIQTFKQDDLVNVSKFICECMAVMLGVESDERSQTSDQP